MKRYKVLLTCLFTYFVVWSSNLFCKELTLELRRSKIIEGMIMLKDNIKTCYFYLKTTKYSFFFK